MRQKINPQKGISSISCIFQNDFFLHFKLLFPKQSLLYLKEKFIFSNMHDSMLWQYV